MQSIHPRLATGSRVTTASGIVEGIADQDAGIHSFRGIPFAAPPVGDGSGGGESGLRGGSTEGGDAQRCGRQGR